MITVWTVAGAIEFDEADAHSVSPPNLPPSPGNTQVLFAPQTLPGGLKLWKLDPGGDEEKAKLLAWFSPTGWIAIEWLS
jgi:hypothetical protein